MLGVVVVEVSGFEEDDEELEELVLEALLDSSAATLAACPAAHFCIAICLKIK